MSDFQSAWNASEPKDDVQYLSSYTDPELAAIINTIGPLRQVVTAGQKESRRYLVIATGTAKEIGQPVQIQLER